MGNLPIVLRAHHHFGVGLSLGGAYTRALKSEKPLSPPIPVGEGAVDTHDWCFNYTGRPIIIAIYPLIR